VGLAGQGQNSLEEFQQLLPVAGIELQVTRLGHSVGNDQRLQSPGLVIVPPRVVGWVQGQAVILNPRDHLIDKAEPLRNRASSVQFFDQVRFVSAGRRKKVEPLLRPDQSPAVGRRQ